MKYSKKLKKVDGIYSSTRFLSPVDSPKECVEILRTVVTLFCSIILQVNSFKKLGLE